MLKLLKNDIRLIAKTNFVIGSILVKNKGKKHRI